MSSSLECAQYLLSAHTADQLPTDNGSEVAFAGRSNAGKSSVLNTLTRQNALARVSKTPGRTQQLVYFTVTPQRYLVDLPGYGYAKVPKELQVHWQTFIDSYFRNREALRGLVVVMDIRHPLKEYDLNMLAYATQRNLPAQAVLTKADKLGRSQQAQALQHVRKELTKHFGDHIHVHTFSSKSRQGVDELHTVIESWLGLKNPV
ncbi:MAG TPA: ribosome biogenesis GTP-binding protein YihA/YsxC [Xylella sp.]